MLKFNNKPIPSFLKITGFSFSVLPEINVKNVEVPGRFGSLDNGVDFGAKTFSFDFVVKKDNGLDVYTMANQFKEWAAGDNWKPSKLVFDVEPNKYLLARVASNIEISDLFVAGEGSFEMVAANPIKYDVTETSKDFTNKILSFDYNGLEKAPVLLELKPAANCTKIDVTQETPNKHTSSLLGSFKAGQTILLDSDFKTVKVNGAISMKSLGLEHDWIYLEKGYNSFKITSDVNIEAKIKFRKAD